MKVSLSLPFDQFQIGDEFLDFEAISMMAKIAEKAGFFSGLVTDHPVPTGRWLDAGGHHAQDPFVMMSFVAAATTTLQVQTGILVLPYRNPFITARSVATLDVLSGGRVRLGVGSGYMKGEYRALGVDFDTRGEKMDEYILALKAAWTNDEFSYKGTDYEALGNRIHPRPIQKPHPPILIGGNGKRAIRRAAELGDAWNPFPTASSTLAATSRTVEFSTDEDIVEGIALLRAECERIGRADVPGVELAGLPGINTFDNSQMILDKLGRYTDLGISAVGVHFNGSTRASWCDNIEKFGAEVIAKLD
jgi:probable F420-dependent oxidoreductase